ncbi:MAG: hybrid sensor histidine kinase/response regulator [Inquilinaceae bacterium]
MDDLLSEFLTETSENLAVLDVELVRLEQNPNDPSLLGNIFRLVHTIKGTCGFLGLPRLEAVAHAGENILGKFRDGELEVTPEAVSLILAALDRIKELVATLEATETEPEGEDSELIGRLNAMADGETAPTPSAAPVEATPEAPAVEAVAEPDPAPVEEVAVEEEIAVEEDEFGFTPMSAAALEAQMAAEPAAAPDAVAESDEEPTAEPERAAESPAEVPVEAVAEAPARQPAAKAAAAPPAEKVEAKESAVASQSIRVHVDLLENLMTMVSELVLTRNQLLQIMRSNKDSEFTAPLQRLNHVTSELQEGVMKTRMQPIGNAWAKLPRLIRDLSQELDKKIDLQMLGADTELDRQVLELIKDPLTHMVRNSADHGIEPRADRIKVGKPETGTVRLNAYHEGGHIIIEITDDGRGLALGKIKAKAVANGLATESELEGLSDQQIQQFVFKAGFSTAEKVTSVSGRGVGMDVVKTNIEKIGGTVELKSIEGRGSTFMIKIPLTLAIVSALIVEAGGERFAVPQISVIELVRAGNNSEHTVELLNGTPVLRLRDRLLPLVSLPKLLKLEAGDGKVVPKTDVEIDTEAQAEAGNAVGAVREDDTYIVVTQVGTYIFGIIVDRVFDTEEIVVKPVSPIMRHLDIFSGNTILGDGAVIMILDPNGIASATGEISVADGADMTDDASRGADSDQPVALLVFRAGGGAPKAVPLALIARLEDIALDTVESSNNQHVVQYRGKLMPLLAYDRSFSLEAARETETRRPVLVFTDNDHSMGLIVDEIVDIVEQRMDVELAGDDGQVLGTAIIAGQATDVIDAGYYLTLANKDWFGKHSEALGEDQTNRILLVDDSPFFRNMLTPLLSVAGYEVTTVESASEALALCEAGESFDIIVSDIEMPGMNGFDFAEHVRNGGKWQNTPIVALSSHATPRDLDRGRKVGFTDYVAKMDRDALLSSLSQTLADARGAA